MPRPPLCLLPLPRSVLRQVSEVDSWVPRTQASCEQHFRVHSSGTQWWLCGSELGGFLWPQEEVEAVTGRHRCQGISSPRSSPQPMKDRVSNELFKIELLSLVDNSGARLHSPAEVPAGPHLGHHTGSLLGVHCTSASFLPILLPCPCLWDHL